MTRSKAIGNTVRSRMAALIATGKTIEEAAQILAAENTAAYLAAQQAKKDRKAAKRYR